MSVDLFITVGINSKIVSSCISKLLVLVITFRQILRNPIILLNIISGLSILMQRFLSLLMKLIAPHRLSASTSGSHPGR